MDGREIMLNDGTVLSGCGAGYADGTLWIYPEMTMKEAAPLFLDEEKTAAIIYRRDDEAVRYTGFTDCILMNAVPGGLRIQMTGTDTHAEEVNENE